MTTQTDEQTEGAPRRYPKLSKDAEKLLTRFRVLGLRLKEWRTRRGEDADAERARIAEEIREAYDEGQDLGVYVGEMTEALGVSRQRLYQILGNVQQVRTPPQRDMFLVALTERQRDALLRVTTGSTDPDLASAAAALQHGRAVTKRTARQAVGQ
jgi:hypothetical protein